MPSIHKIKRFLRQMGLDTYEVRGDDVIVQVPAKNRIIQIHVLVRDPYLGLKLLFLKKPRTNTEVLHKWLLKRNVETFIVKWGLDDSDNVLICTERLLRDLDFSEFEAAMTMIIAAFNDNIDIATRMVH